ncbi:winged helix-turn-helix transcriptional regulator [Candidatus Epulonipiscium viviparus]|uniref:winged helix-turn-helix transcriptional regulator n=1 Tax=Candidatus Epulonipiscium viviparus TaxID=420336 RepID=UPI00016C0620|nr:helix-turn-helix domain-containing protein [Candidatus Epulopiscium viviparus]
MSKCEATHCPCLQECPLQSALKCIGGKWKIPIICVLSAGEGIRYNELMKKVRGITNTMLALSLKELERDGLITRVQYNEMPIRVEYFITEKAKTLIPTLQSLAAWGMA